MLKKILLFVFLILPSVFVLAQYPLIHTERPRIYADSSRISWLHDHITVPGECRDTYTNFLYAYNNWWINDPQLYLLGSDSTQWTWDWSSQWAGSEAFYTVFIYKITGDALALKRCRFLSRQVVSYISTAAFTGMEWYTKENLLRQMSDAGDILLDWCYTDLPSAQRDELAQSVYLMNREYMNTYILSGSGTSFVSSHNTWNTIFCNQNTLSLFESSGLTAQQKDTVSQWYQAVYNKLTNGFIPCWTYYRDDDGGWNWGAAYAMWSLVDQFQLFENMRIATGKNFYTDLPWVRNSINQYVYFMQPNNKCIHLGDGETAMAGDRVTYVHAAIFNDPRSLWMAQYWSQASLTPNTNQKFAKLLYKDFNSAAVTQPNLPLDWWTDKVGLSVSRSSWNSDATMVTFFNSPSKKAAHEHRDNNTFTIFRDKPLLVDAGYYDTYGGTHYRNYYQRTIAHNGICVFDSTETYSCFGQPASNDGGQVESNALQNYNEIFLPQNQRGKWIKYAFSSQYAYNIADAQLSYNPDKLDFFRRRLLYIKPGKVIVLDHVHLKNSATKQRYIKWTGHFEQKPEISGNILKTTVAGHIETYNGKDITASNGNGKIAIRTLLPLKTAVTLIGGNGYEYWVNGTNYPPLTPPDTAFYTAGHWRIEVTPTNISDTVIFLHTIAIGDLANAVMAGGIAVKNNVSVGTDWNDTLYFFAADAATGKSYHIFDHIAGGRTVGIFATDMMAGLFDIKVDGIISSVSLADSNGILQSAVALMQGLHTIEVATINTSFPVNGEAIPFQVYPNPAHSEINILMNTGLHSSGFEIYNIKGRRVIESPDAGRIDISGLATGIYLLKLKQDDKWYSTKFIKK